MRVRSITVVISAPSGVAGCVFLDEMLAQAAAMPFEIVVADATPGPPSAVPRAVRVVKVPGGGIQQLIAEGVRAASGDWILVTEDHCRPLPGLIAAYRDAVAAHPGADLFSGATENLTSTSPWSFANFIVGLRTSWPEFGFRDADATNANLLIRRGAILANELATEGALLNLTVPRLIALGRQRNCPTACVDHVLPLTALGAVEFVYRCAQSGAAVRRATVPPRPAAVQFLRDCAGLIYYALVFPWRTLAKLRATSQFSLATGLRLTALGIAVGAATFAADLRRWSRPPAAR